MRPIAVWASQMLQRWLNMMRIRSEVDFMLDFVHNSYYNNILSHCEGKI